MCPLCCQLFSNIIAHGAHTRKKGLTMDDLNKLIAIFTTLQLYEGAEVLLEEILYSYLSTDEALEMLESIANEYGYDVETMFN